ncbi:MAG: hypothetical protein N2379_00080 [Verrucomicrobiae bacterium]|nr:hypothetical protein [Verrucomicrobiae bacterium]
MIGIFCSLGYSADPPVGATRVVIIEAPGAVHLFQPSQQIVAAMINHALTNLTGQPDPAAAWRSLVSPTDVIGIKVYAAPGPLCGTRVATAAAVIEGLIESGLNPTNIIVWDKRYADLKAAGFTELAPRYGVQVKGAIETGFDEAAFYESPILGALMWGDLEFGKHAEVLGRNSYVTKLLTKKVTKIVSIAPLLNNHLTGAAGHMYSLAMGSVDNAARFEVSADRLAIAVPEICALPELRDRLVLCITDALICQYEGAQRCLLHYSTVLNQVWVARDPVALDLLAVHEIARQRRSAGAPTRELDLALYQNAGLLELGVSDTNKLTLVRLSVPTSQAVPASHLSRESTSNNTR